MDLQQGSPEKPRLRQLHEIAQALSSERSGVRRHVLGGPGSDETTARHAAFRAEGRFTRARWGCRATSFYNPGVQVETFAITSDRAAYSRGYFRLDQQPIPPC